MTWELWSTKNKEPSCQSWKQRKNRPSVRLHGRTDLSDEHLRPACLVQVCAFGPEASCENSDRNVSFTDSTWAWHKRWDDSGAWSSDVERSSMPLSSWQRPTDVDILHSHDPWRSHHWQDTVDDSPSPHSSVPYPSGNCQLPLPPQDEPPRPPPGLRSRHGARSSATSSAAIQVEPVRRRYLFEFQR